MSRLFQGLVVGVMMVIFIGCEKKESPPSALGAASAATPKPARAPVPEAPKELAGFVVVATVVKKAPNESPKVEEKGKQVPNWLATLSRGEMLTLLNDEGDYRRVKTSSDVEGWVKKAAILAASDVQIATVLGEVEAFDRPDLLALNSKKTVRAGTLLFVLKSKGQFSETNVNGWASAWVLTAKLSHDLNEINVSKMLARARELKAANNASGAEELLKLARSTSGAAKLIGTFENELQ